MASYAAAVELTSRYELEQAVARGEIRRGERGRYALAEIDEARRVAHAATGVVSHLSAALVWGWKVKAIPERPHVTVPRNRNLEGVPPFVPHWLSLEPEDVVDGVTSPGRTLVDCLRGLPFDEALTVADSALRAGVPRAELERAASLRGPGSANARRAVAAADGRAANPFESVLRAIALNVPGLHVVPQAELRLGGLVLRPDLMDRERRLVIEADSHEWHNRTRAQLQRDCRRYTALSASGWKIARFAWEDVMHRPAFVHQSLIALTAASVRTA